MNNCMRRLTILIPFFQGFMVAWISRYRELWEKCTDGNNKIIKKILKKLIPKRDPHWYNGGLLDFLYLHRGKSPITNKSCKTNNEFKIYTSFRHNINFTISALVFRKFLLLFVATGNISKSERSHAPILE